MISILNIVLTLVFVLVSMILHELAHGFVAYALGDNTAKDEGRLTLNPIKHLDPYMSLILPVFLYFLGGPIFGGAKPVPVNKNNLKGGVWGMALVTLVGPLTNFILAFVGFLVYRFGAIELAYSFMTINLCLMVFNLIPIPPLDGSRILYAISPDGVRDFMDKIEPYGFIIIYGFILFFNTAFSSVMIGGLEGVYRFFILITGG